MKNLHDIPEYQEYGRALKQKKYSLAISMLESIIKKYEYMLSTYQVAHIYISLGERYFDIKQSKRAIECYEESYKKFDSSIISKYYLAKSLIERELSDIDVNNVISQCIEIISREGFSTADDDFSPEEYLSMITDLKNYKKID
jgi:tetratricopeptide (TPR) repeat protein